MVRKSFDYLDHSIETSDFQNKYNQCICKATNCVWGVLKNVPTVFELANFTFLRDLVNLKFTSEFQN